MINSVFIFLSRRLRRLADAARERQEANKRRMRLIKGDSVMLVTTGGKTVLKFLNNSTVKKPKEKTYLRLDKLTSVMFIGAKNKTSFKFLN